MHLHAAVGRVGHVVILAGSGPAAASRQVLDGPHIVVDVVNEAGVHEDHWGTHKRGSPQGRAATDRRSHAQFS